MRNRTRGRKLAGLAGIAVLATLACMAWIFQDELRRWHQLLVHFDRLGRNAQGYPEYRHTRSGIVFVLLPGAEFMMGSGESESGSWDERPRHLVRLSPFLIAKYEVSQGEWSRGRQRDSGMEVDLPVRLESWDECKSFCESHGLQLPSEAQWEYAARGGARGDSGGAERLRETAWYGNGAPGPNPVGRKEPNGFGLHDLFGNVWEWCEDSYNESFYSSPEAARLDPVCSRGLRFRVLRGGSWRSPADWCRAGFRATGTMAIEECGLRPVWVFPKE